MPNFFSLCLNSFFIWLKIFLALKLSHFCTIVHFSTSASVQPVKPEHTMHRKVTFNAQSKLFTTFLLYVEHGNLEASIAKVFCRYKKPLPFSPSDVFLSEVFSTTNVSFLLLPSYFQAAPNHQLTNLFTPLSFTPFLSH